MVLCRVRRIPLFDPFLSQLNPLRMFPSYLSAFFILFWCVHFFKVARFFRVLITKFCMHVCSIHASQPSFGRIGRGELIGKLLVMHFSPLSNHFSLGVKHSP
jgi:hypothetical protein